MLHSSNKEPPGHKVKVDWLVTEPSKTRKEISVMAKQATKKEVESDFIKLVKEGVDISNANLVHFGVDPVFPLIQAEGKYPFHFASLR